MTPRDGQRIALNIVLLVSVFLLPWWLTLIVAAVLTLHFSAYEAVLAGLLLDILYAAPMERYLGMEFVFTILFVLLAILSLIVRRYTSFANRLRV